jgi:putative endonuclease
MSAYHVYILSNPSRTLYIGVTNHLARRIYEHKEGRGSDFTTRYKVDLLVYCEAFEQIRDAILREKQLKGWTRVKKIALIESLNPDWKDLSLHF